MAKTIVKFTDKRPDFESPNIVGFNISSTGHLFLTNSAGQPIVVIGPANLDYVYFADHDTNIKLAGPNKLLN